MSSAEGVQFCQRAAVASEIKAQDQTVHQQHYSSQAYVSGQERVQSVNHDYLSSMRESLFRLLSKVPIQIETVRPTHTTTTGYATAGHQQLASRTSNLDQRQTQLVRRQRQPSDHLRDPLVIKYYQDKSLADIIELHFGCSLMSSTHHVGGWQASSKAPKDVGQEYPNQQQYHELSSPSVVVPPGPTGALNGAAKSADRRPAARRPLPTQRTASNKSLQRDKFNGQTKNVAPLNAASGHICRSKQAGTQRRTLRLQQQQRLLPSTTMNGFNAGGQTSGGGFAMQTYRLAGSYDSRLCPPAMSAGDGVPSNSCAGTTITYDEPQAQMVCQHQDQFVYVGGSSSASSQLVPQIDLGSPPSSASCMQDQLPNQHVIYAPTRGPSAVNHAQLDYNQYQHYAASTPDETQQQQFNSYGALVQSEVSPAHEYHSHPGHALHCDSQHQQQQQQQFVWQPHDQVHQHSEHFGASHQHHTHVQCGNNAPPPPPHIDHHQHTFIHFNVTDLNQMIEQQQQQHGCERQVVSKSEYFQKNPSASYDGNCALVDNRDMPRNQLIYHHNNLQSLEMTAPLQQGDGLNHSRQGSSLESNSSSSSSSSSSSCSSSASSSSSSSTTTSIRRGAGPTTPLVDTNAPRHLDDCLHLEQINPRLT